MGNENSVLKGGEKMNLLFYVVLIYLISIFIMLFYFWLDKVLKTDLVIWDKLKSITYGQAISIILFLPYFCYLTMDKMSDEIFGNLYERSFLSKRIRK